MEIICSTIFGLLSLAGVSEQFRTRQIVHAVLSLVSAVFFALFVVAYYHQPTLSVLGIFIIPMLIFVAVYDWWLSDLDLQPGSKQFMKPLPDVKSRMNDITAMIILLPGYLAGLALSYRLIMNG